MPATSAAIYARISSDPEHEKLGVTRQLQDCRMLAAKLGWPVTTEYVDNDLSAYTGKRRPAYDALCQAIDTGEVNALLVWHSDRLHRSPLELENFIDLCERHQVAVQTVTAGPVDLATPTGRAVARTVGAWARFESEHKAERLRRKGQELAYAGRLPGGTRPFGYQADRRTIDPEEAALIHEAADRILAGDSLRSLANDWNDRGISTVKGGLWNPSVIRAMLISARLSGQRQYHGNVVAQGDWQPILTPQETSRLHAKLTDPARRLCDRTARRYLLAGLLRCGLCGSVLRSKPNDHGSRTYVCRKEPNVPACARISISADHLEHFIVRAVLHRLDSPALAEALGRRPPVAAPPAASAAPSADQQLLEANRSRLAQLAEAYGRAEITWDEFRHARAPIAEAMDKARRRIAAYDKTIAVAPFVGNSELLRARWEELTLARQHAIVGAILAHAVVDSALVPGRAVFDEGRVRPVWRV